ncbi:MAG: hypothetical protein ACRDTE_26505 [Pseudonocardiaceae bacterium]
MLIAVAVVAAMVVLVAGVAALSGYDVWTWLSLTPLFQFYAGVVVAWVSIRRRGASTPELQRAQPARLALGIPLVGPVTFVLVFVLMHDDLAGAIHAAVAATIGVAIAALIGYLQWARRASE